ncbi:MAG: hypothetical protein AAF458_00890 [Pseudomonadota bacterium]
MSLYDPPEVNVDTGPEAQRSRFTVLMAAAVPWVITLLTLYFITPVISAGAGASLEDGSAAQIDRVLLADLILDFLFVGIGCYWALELSRLPRWPTAVLFGLGLFAVHVVEVGGVPGVIDTGLPAWYQFVGNFNDVVGAVLAAATHAALGGVASPPDPGAAA